MDTTYAFSWGYYIVVYDTPYPTGKVVEVLKWRDLTFELFCKYKWYFEYRYALLRIKYPKVLIRREQIKSDLTPKMTVDLLKKKITSKKRVLSKYQNKLSDYVKSWSSLFPITDDESYQLAIQKIERLESELQELLNEQKNG